MDPKQILVDHGNRISAPFAQLPAELLSRGQSYNKMKVNASKYKMFARNNLGSIY